MPSIIFDLKVCEACGALWTRVRGLREPYCSACKPTISALPKRTTRKLPARPRHRRLHLVQAVCGVAQ